MTTAGSSATYWQRIDHRLGVMDSDMLRRAVPLGRRPGDGVPVGQSVAPLCRKARRAWGGEVSLASVAVRLEEA
jgi:hypothetical protein